MTKRNFEVIQGGKSQVQPEKVTNEAGIQPDDVDKRKTIADAIRKIVAKTDVQESKSQE